MRKILFVVAVLAVVVLGGREVAMAQENGTVPQNAVWLPIVGNVNFEEKCGVSEGEYRIHSNQHGDQWHQVAYYIKGSAQPDKILIATNSSFENVIAEGGSFGGIIPNPYDRFRILIGGQLEAKQTYYARMKYLCDGILAQTPVLPFVAQELKD